MQIVSNADSLHWNIKSCFLENIRKNIINISSAEFTQRVVKVY